jgi:hypothetical protein
MTMAALASLQTAEGIEAELATLNGTDEPLS